MNLATLAGRALRAFALSRTWGRAAALAVSAAALVAAPAFSRDGFTEHRGSFAVQRAHGLMGKTYLGVRGEQHEQGSAIPSEAGIRRPGAGRQVLRLSALQCDRRLSSHHFRVWPRRSRFSACRSRDREVRSSKFSVICINRCPCWFSTKVGRCPRTLVLSTAGGSSIRQSASFDIWPNVTPFHISISEAGRGALGLECGAPPSHR